MTSSYFFDHLITHVANQTKSILAFSPIGLVNIYYHRPHIPTSLTNKQYTRRNLLIAHDAITQLATSSRAAVLDSSSLKTLTDCVVARFGHYDATSRELFPSFEVTVVVDVVVDVVASSSSSLTLQWPGLQHVYRLH